ncbi:hypothetical protein ABEB36_011158 [Hypothenemus hampei]|uniref:Hyaluronan/mRNA-binding protein domain-containing protein n=1 Tax=Hypothenemus hampei TaxID=57062 RepID=A0ABD1EEE5_HYPHA
MENSYGIGVANRYELFLDDESDPLETLFQKEQNKDLKKKGKGVAEKENKGKPEPPKGKLPSTTQKKTIKETAPAKIQEKRDENKANQVIHADGKPERTLNKVNNENREERNNRRNREERTTNGSSENRDRENRPRRDKVDFENRNREQRGDRVDRGDRGDRKEGRPFGNRTGGPRGIRKNFDSERRGKREFDRQSGSDKTGVKPIEKKDGAGAHNWGSTKDLIDAEADRPSDNDQSWGDGEKTEVQNDTDKKETSEVEKSLVEEEPKELTLDEWKAQRAGRIKPQYNIRKAGEGEDPSQWKKMFELKKKEKEEESEEEEYDASEYPQRVGRQKHILDIDIQFNDNRRPGGGRSRVGGRGPKGARPGGGGPRGSPRDRDGPREGAGREERRFREDPVDEKAPRAPKVDDERDFPSLS